VRLLTVLSCCLLYHVRRFTDRFLAPAHLTGARVRLHGGACQLCTLPLGHLWQCHQMTLLLPNVVLSGRFPFSLFLSWSHCFSKAWFACAKVGCFCRVPSASLPRFAFAHLGHPVLLRAFIITGACHSCKQALHFHWALMLLQTVNWSGDIG